MADAQDRQNEEQVNGNTSDAVNNTTETTSTGNGGNNGGAVSAESQRIAELEAQLAQAKQQAAENWNKFLRERAEMDNFRKRQERLAQERLQREKKALFEKVLGVIDNVERALAYQETMDKQGLQQALRMLMWQMNEVMRGEGVTPIPSVGEHFNPYVHEAIEAVEDSDQPEGTIVEEVQKGYKFGDETLRPARVRVSAGNKQSSESSTQAQS